MSDHEISVYEFVGGEPVIREIVRRFYDRIEADPVLRPMFPDDLGPGREYQALFLIQYFGGPRTYLDVRGHPRLRARHMPFVIDQQARDHWLQHMLDAIDDVGVEEPARGVMRQYFERASEFMINHMDGNHGGA
jgi:hemoglobin